MRHVTKDGVVLTPDEIKKQMKQIDDATELNLLTPAVAITAKFKIRRREFDQKPNSEKITY
jgi:hypothetical protein